MSSTPFLSLPGQNSTESFGFVEYMACADEKILSLTSVVLLRKSFERFFSSFSFSSNDIDLNFFYMNVKKDS